MPAFETQKLWTAGEDGYTTFRIPAIIATKKGTVLVACAGRLDGFKDWSDINTMLRRSTDGGKTWEASRVVTDDAKNVVDNATFLLDGDRILLMYQINYAKAYLKTSEDEGATWSEPTEITTAFDTFKTRDQYAWTVLAMGPGHGITLKSGRLVVPIWLATDHSHRPSVTSTIYSDDHGKTWLAGDIVTQNLPESKNPSENVLTELADGRVMANIRCESETHRRLVAYSADGATAWTEPTPDDGLFDPVCMASMVRYSKAPEGKNRILFCNPDSHDAPQIGNKANSYVRKNITLRMSYDEGKTWPIAKVIEPNLSGYTDLAVTPDGTIFLAYEHGETNGEKVMSSKYLSVAKFKLDWLTDGADKGE